MLITGGAIIAAILWAAYITFLTIGFTIGTYLGHIISEIPIFQILDKDGIINFYFGNFLIIVTSVGALFNYKKHEIKNNLITEMYDSIENKYCIPIRFK